MSVYHNFNIEIAKQYSVEQAIIINHLFFWVEKNKANRHNFFDGKYWTYNSVNAFVELFPYFSKKQISTTLQKLKNNDLIEIGNYNENKYDRTNWYALTDKCLAFFHLENTISPFGKMEITKKENVIYTDNKPINKTHISKQYMRENAHINASSCDDAFLVKQDIQLINELSKNNDNNNLNNQKLNTGDLSTSNYQGDTNTPNIKDNAKKQAKKPVKTHSKVKEALQFDKKLFNQQEITAIEEFIEYRKSIKKAMSQLALDKLINQLTRAKSQQHDIIQAIDNSIVNCWGGVFFNQNAIVRYSHNQENYTSQNKQQLQELKNELEKLQETATQYDKKYKQFDSYADYELDEEDRETKSMLLTLMTELDKKIYKIQKEIKTMQ